MDSRDVDLRLKRQKACDTRGEKKSEYAPLNIHTVNLRLKYPCMCYFVFASVCLYAHCMCVCLIER